MRPQEAVRRINLAFDRWYVDGSVSSLDRALPAMKKLYSRYSISEDDFRSGEETYGYVDKESIENNIMYISDRWRCSFRLRWLIDGLESGDIK